MYRNQAVSHKRKKRRRRKARRNTSWKQAERRVASFFGCMRTILSGSAAHVRKSETNADTDHETLFIEIKQRMKHGTWSWWRKALADSRREAKNKRADQKLVVLALDEIRAKGAIICIHSDDLRRFCELFLSQKKSPWRAKH